MVGRPTWAQWESQWLECTLEPVLVVVVEDTIAFFKHEGLGQRGADEVDSLVEEGTPVVFLFTSLSRGVIGRPGLTWRPSGINVKVEEFLSVRALAYVRVGKKRRMVIQEEATDPILSFAYKELFVRMAAERLQVGEGEGEGIHA